jgi:SAM-dependent methyltransferase
MHYTAEQNVKRFFNNYVYKNSNKIKIVEIGATIGGFNMRSLNPENSTYIGVDLHAGQGIDIVLEDAYKLPFEDSSIDYVISSSCFEHSEFFWLNFLETMRVLKPEGLFYLNAPSNGAYHTFPVDCWRFFPDSGKALVNWGKRNNYNCELLEQYTSNKGNDIWSDYVSVFIKDKDYIEVHNERILYTFTDFTNGSVYPHNEIINLVKW